MSSEPSIKECIEVYWVDCIEASFFGMEDELLHILFIFHKLNDGCNNTRDNTSDHFIFILASLLGSSELCTFSDC